MRQRPEIHIHYHECDCDPSWRARVEHKLDRILGVDSLMAHTAQETLELVRSQTTVEASLIELVGIWKQRATDAGLDQAAVDAIFDEATAQSAALAAAVTENTPPAAP